MDLDRPILSKDQDKWERILFVEHLCRALVQSSHQEPRAGTSTGHVLGLAGEWGSGKSSILNLADEHLRKKFDPILIVRFDPWLISGRDDVIERFFTELLAGLKSDTIRKIEKVEDLISTAERFEELITFSLEFFPIPEEIRSRSSDAWDIVKGKKRSKASIHEAKEEILKIITELKFPIVVLIDEVDRLDDNEVLTIVQLIKAVADFPNISYLLAYDVERIVQVLGAAAPEEHRVERGRSYLEKVVQLQISVPSIFASELERFLCDDLERAQAEWDMPKNFREDPRFRELQGILFEKLVHTPRDLKRLMGIFGTLRQMHKDEISWIDVLGYSAILSKCPDVAALITRDPIFFAYEFNQTERSFRERRGLEDRQNNPATDAEYLGKSWINEPHARLLKFLFGRLESLDQQSGSRIRYQTDAHDQISRYRTLSVLVRHGMPPGTWSMDEVRHLIEEVAEGQTMGLTEGLSSNRRTDLFIVLEMLADRFEDLNLTQFWIRNQTWLCQLHWIRNGIIFIASLERLMQCYLEVERCKMASVVSLEV